MDKIKQDVDLETAEQLFNLPLRIDCVWPLAGVGMSPAPEGLRQALECRRPAELAWLRPAYDDADPDEDGDIEIDENDEIWDEFGGECIARGLLGVVLDVHIPVMRGNPSGSISYSWGHFSTRAIYAPTLSEGVAAAMKMAEAAYEAARQKGMAQ